MRIEAIAIGKNPPDDINVIVEVPLGGQPVQLAERLIALGCTQQTG